MSKLSESELQEIVQRIVQRTVGDREPVSSGEAGINPITPRPAGEDKQVNKTRRIAIAADHGGYPLKEILKAYLQKQG